MKFKNSTDFSDRFLRRMLSWVCREVGYPLRRIRDVEFGNRQTAAYSGRAWYSRRILVRVGPEPQFPKRETRPGTNYKWLVDRTEALVVVTAHEVAHLLQYSDGRIHKLNDDRRCERDARWQESRVLLAFRDARETLLAEWSDEPEVESKPKPAAKSKQEKNAEKADAKLREWQRKLKLAQTKVRQYKAKVKRYERLGVLAATSEK